MAWYDQFCYQPSGMMSQPGAAVTPTMTMPGSQGGTDDECRTGRCAPA